MNNVFVAAVLGAALSFWFSSSSNAQSGDLVVKWGLWSNWTKCSVTCGGGEMTRERRCITPGVSEKRCLRLRRRECGRRRCPGLDETPGMMSTATQTSTEMSTSMPTPEPSLNTTGGDMKPSGGTVTMPPPEEMTDMTPDGAPNVNLTTEGMNYTRPTPEGMPDTKDYSMSPWGEWSLCEAQCGGGMRYRTRVCADPSEGPECENAEGQECNTEPCTDGVPTGEPGVTEDVQEDVKPTPEQIPDTTPMPEDMTNMGMGNIKPDAEGMSGTTDAIDTTDMQTEPDTKPTPEGVPDMKDYSMAPWSEWSPCDANCGGGMQYRARQCEEPPGRPECEDAEGRICNAFPCDIPIPTGEPPITDVPEEDGPGPWSDWTNCTRPCEIGESFRSRKCPSASKESCMANQTRLCNRFRCPDVYTPWTSWSACGKSCDEGVQFQSSVCVNNTRRDDCQLFRARRCNTNPCPDPDMEYTSWSSWTPCSTSCGGGMRYRVRECNKLNGRTDCEESVDETCNTQKCSESERSDNSTLESTNPEPAFSTEPVPMPQMTNTSEMTSKAPLSGREERQRARELRLQCGSKRTEASIHTFVTAISPGFPKDYPGGLDCMWTVVAPRATRIKIIIDIFEASVGDKLTLLEGKPREMPYKEARITTLTGAIKQGAKYSSIGRYLTVRLQTKMNTMGGKYSIRFRATSTKLEDEEDHENLETAPKEEIWYKILRLLLTWLYRGQKEM